MPPYSLRRLSWADFPRPIGASAIGGIRAGQLGAVRTDATIGLKWTKRLAVSRPILGYSKTDPPAKSASTPWHPLQRAIECIADCDMRTRHPIHGGVKGSWYRNRGVRRAGAPVAELTRRGKRTLVGVHSKSYDTHNQPPPGANPRPSCGGRL